jgi:peptidyl-prolyl cis-trans isomerase D
MLLQVIRDRAQGVFVWVIVGAIALSFALFGINDYFTGDDSGYQAAIVNGNDVSVNEYQVAYQNERARMEQMFGGQVDLDLMDQQIKNSALERVVDNAVIMHAAIDAGIRVSDAQIANQIHAIDAFKESGQFSKDVYEQTLRVSGQSTGGFEQRVRRSLVADQLVMGVGVTSFVSPQEVDRMYRLTHQEREGSYFIVKSNEFKKDISVSDDEINTHYQSNQDRYMTEEMVSLEYLELSADDLMSQVEVTSDDIEEAYEEQKDTFLSPEEVQAAHILFEVGDDASAAKAKAEAAHARLVKGEDFAAVAKELSEDLGSAADGGDLGFIEHGMMDGAFDDTAFSLSSGEVSKPVRSEFGYHIIKVGEKRGGEGKSLADVRDQLETQLRRKEAERLYFDQSELLATVAYENPESLDPAMDELGLVIKSTGKFGRNGGAGISNNRKVIDAAFSDIVLLEGLNSDAIELDSTHTIVIRRKEHVQAEVRPLADVSASIKSTLSNDKASDAAKAKVDALVAEISSGKAAADVAKAAGYDNVERQWLGRDNRELQPNVVSKLFSLPKTESETLTQSVALPNGDYAVVSLYAVREGDISKMSAAEKDEMLKAMQDSSGMAEFTAFLGELRGRAEIERFPGNL